MNIQSIYRSMIFLPPCLILLFLLFLLFPANAQADGGAPNLAYVAGTAHGVSVIDIGQQKVTKTISVSGDPHMVLLSLDGRFMYVSEPQQNRVAIFSASTGSTICTASLAGQPTLLAFDPGTNYLYAAGSGASTITALDANNCNTKFVIHTNGPVYGMAVAIVGSGLSGSTGNQLWVSTDTLTVYDDFKGQAIATVAIPGGPQYVSVPAGTTVYVTTRQGSVDAVDLSTHKVITLVSGGSYGPMDYDAITGEVYVPDRQNQQLTVLAPVTVGVKPPPEPIRTIHLGVAPQSVAITSDGQLGFIALSNGNVVMLDIPGRQVVNTIFVGGTPQFVVTGLYPPIVGTTPQQASTYGTLISIGAYAFVIALFAVPVWFFTRYVQATRKQREEEAKQE